MTEITPSPMQFQMLASLSNGACTGPELRQTYEARFGEELRLGTTHTVLTRLCERGWVQKLPDPENKARRIYRITPQGREAVRLARQRYRGARR